MRRPLPAGYTFAVSVTALTPVVQPPSAVAAHSAGSRQAVEAALVRHYPGLMNVLTRRVGDPQLARDMLQDAIVTALAKVDDGVEVSPQHVAGYVFRTALNHLRNHRRHERQNGGADVLDGIADERAPTALEQSQRDSNRALVRRVLHEMNVPRDREVLVRLYLDDQDRERICEDLGLSDVQFNKVVARARERLRRLLDEAGIGRWDVLLLAALVPALRLFG